MKTLANEMNEERHMLKPSTLFSESDLTRIKHAVGEAERKTSGEIVPYVVEMSDTYEIAEWRAGVLCGLVALGSCAAVRQFTTAWLPVDVVGIALVSMLSAASGAFLTHALPILQRVFAGRQLLDLRVQQRAIQAFVAEEVFATKDRTGILIFLSLLERKVIVLGDSGINAKVKQSVWDGIVALITSAIKQGRPADGLVAAIKECGMLLEEHGVGRRRNDTDELPDTLRMGDRQKP